MPSAMRIAYFGSAAFAVPTLQALLQSTHQVVVVVTQPDKPGGRGRALMPTPIATLATDAGIPTLKPTTLKDPQVETELRTFQPDILVVAAYGKLIPPELIHLPPFRAVNLHPSLLPQYRGAAPIQYALLNGDAVTGVTTMYVTDEMDAGDILLQAESPIHPHETAIELSDRLAKAGATLMVHTLDGLRDGAIQPRPQDATAATFTKRLEKEDGHIDWRRPARAIINQIRALQPWPSAYTHWQEKLLKVYQAEIPDSRAVPVNAQPGEIIEITRSLHIVTGDGRLCLTDLQLEGKRRMSSTDFLRGYAITVGERFA